MSDMFDISESIEIQTSCQESLTSDPPTDDPAPSAYRILERLQESGIVKGERVIRGVRAWSVPGLTSALDRFAERAGRRTFNQG